MNPASASSATLKVLYSSVLTNTGVSASFNWDTLISAIPGLIELQVSSTHLGNSTLPPKLPAGLTTLLLVDCGLNGTIPSTLLDLHTGVLIDIELNNNDLEGTIPATLFSKFSIANIQLCVLDFSGNKLNGTIPKALFSGTWSLLITLSLRLSNNQLEGPITNAFQLATFPSFLNAATALFSGNRGLNGSVPNWFTSQCSMAVLSLQASGCSLTGTIPNIFVAAGAIPPLWRS